MYFPDSKSVGWEYFDHADFVHTPSFDPYGIMGKVWLTDDHIDRAMRLLRKEKTGIAGFQDSCLGVIGKYKTHSSNFIQIHNSAGQHWIMITSVNCRSGLVRVFDSKYRHLSQCTVKALKTLTGASGKYLTVEMPEYQCQNNDNDCGLFSIASAVAVTRGYDPSTLNFKQSSMRHHLMSCFDRNQMELFPFETKNVKRLKRSIVNISICSACLDAIGNDEKKVRCAGCQFFCHQSGTCLTDNSLCIQCFKLQS